MLKKVRTIMAGRMILTLPAILLNDIMRRIVSGYLCEHTLCSRRQKYDSVS